jgi:hypothetical protein
MVNAAIAKSAATSAAIVLLQCSVATNIALVKFHNREAIKQKSSLQ